MPSTVHSQHHRTWAATGSLLFHATLALLLLLAMRGCDGGEGDGTQYMALSIASLGEFEQGMGKPTETPVSASQPEPQETQPAEEEPVETVDESPVTAPKTSEKPRTTPTEKPVEKPTEKPVEAPRKPSDALNNAINQLGKPGSSSGSTQPGGNEGAPNGQIEGKGVFSGGGGGNGEWSLAGRGLRTAPSLNEKPTQEGRVVVDIWVDKMGNVVKAVANPAGSNTTSSQLFALAEKAALSARFSPSEAAAQQRGTITIFFKLN